MKTLSTLALAMALEKGTACRFPLRLSCSISARNVSLLAANSAT